MERTHLIKFYSLVKEVMSDCNDSTDKNGDHLDNGQISLAVKKCIERIARKDGFMAYNVHVQSISTNGGNYFANLQAINVKGKTKYEEKEINLFVKNRFVNSELSIVSFDEVYQREAFFYNELVPIYNKLQEEAKVPVHEMLKVAKGYEESNSDVTILEDLSKGGCQTPHRLETMSIQFAELSVKQLAKFHALSFVLQDRRPEYFENTLKSLKILIQLNSEWELFMDNMCNAAVICLDGDPKYRLKKYKPNIKENYKKFINALETMPTCLCHGDFRPNNIMILEKNGEIQDLVAVDFQMIHYGSPVIDFIYFLFAGSDQKFRINHLDGLKDLYYETFQNFLKYFDINAQTVYPKKRFEQEYRDNLDHGLNTFLMLVPFLFCGDSDFPDLQNGMSGVNFDINNDACKERLLGVVDDFIKWGYL